jgi:ankyrin repeat protein
VHHEGVTDLIDAVRAGDVRTVQTILGSQPGLASARDADGTSAVRLAYTGGHRRVLDALLAAGPDLDVFDAAALGHVNQLEILLGLDPSLATSTASDGTTPLHLAARFGHVAAARRLLDAGAEAGALTATGESAAAVASAAGHPDLAQMLSAAP